MSLTRSLAKAMKRCGPNPQPRGQFQVRTDARGGSPLDLFGWAEAYRRADRLSAQCQHEAADVFAVMRSNQGSNNAERLSSWRYAPAFIRRRSPDCAGFLF